MAYGLKYELLCRTRKGNLYKAKIYFRDYVGSQIDRDVPLNPFKLRKDRASVIKGTSFEYSIREQVDFEFLEFYTNSFKKVKVEFCDSSDNLIWVGYNLPNQYQVSYVPRATVSFTATDGLGLLKTEPFTLTGRVSQLEIIRHCIDKIDLGLGYNIAVYLFHSSHDQTRTPLAQTYEDGEIYSSLNCYEVIEQILKKYNAEISQIRGRWAIIRGKDKQDTRMLYSAAGVYEGTEDGPAVLTLGQAGEAGVSVWPRGVLNMSVEPGAKSVIIRSDYGRKLSFFGSPTAGDWVVTGDFVPENKIAEGGAYVFIPGRNDTQHWLHKTVSVLNVPNQDFVFSIKTAAIGSRLYGGLPIRIVMDITIMVQLSDGVNARWLQIHDDNTAEWSETPSDITRKNASVIGGEPFFNTLSIITPEIPFDGNMSVFLGRYHSMDGVNDSAWNIVGVGYADLQCYFVENGELYPSGFENKVNFVNSTEPNDLKEINIMVADAPDLPNAGLLYKNITRLEDGTPT